MYNIECKIQAKLVHDNVTIVHVGHPINIPGFTPFIIQSRFYYPEMGEECSNDERKVLLQNAMLLATIVINKYVLSQLGPLEINFNESDTTYGEEK